MLLKSIFQDYFPSKYLRRRLIGLAAGTISGMALAAKLDHGFLGIALGAVIGVLYAVCFRPAPRAYIDNLMTGVAFSIPLWAMHNVVLFPLLAGRAPMWTAEGMRALFPQLAAWAFYGAGLGLFVQALHDLALRQFGTEPAAAQPPEIERKQIVILGGGFAGMATAENLERIFGADRSVEFTLISETNALLFSPMLSEVAGSSLEPTHISAPLRTSLHRTRVLRGKIAKIDLERRLVTVALDKETSEIGFDHLVLALGSISNYFGAENIRRCAFDFKTLLDAIRIRNHVIDMFEIADREANAAHRRELLSFVIAGGGFAGVELAGALNDFARGILADYPNLRADDLRIILVHGGRRILPELSEPLAAYALARMTERGVTFKLDSRLADARPGASILASGEEINARTLVWTAGTIPNPLVKALPLEFNRRGAVLVESSMAVPGRAGLWALGDCAEVTDAKNGKPCPPTAQFALRQARTLARNIRASVKGESLRPFHFDSLGSLCVIGHQTACAELTVPFARNRSVRFSGLLAWLLWRGIYLAKLPGRERKVRVMIDWAVELFFPRDIVQTIDFSEMAASETERGASSAAILS